jgi:fatty acid desaturase
MGRDMISESLPKDWAPVRLTHLSLLVSAKTGRSWAEFRKGLPKDPGLWPVIDLVSTWALVSACLLLVSRLGFPWNWALLVPVTLLLTLLLLRVTSFLHEAAHFNLFRDRQRNDLFGNVLAGLFFATSVDGYRTTHVWHHKDLGEALDPESSYVDEFDWLWVASVLSGRASAKIVARRRQILERHLTVQDLDAYRVRTRNFLIVSASCHAATIVVLAAVAPVALLAWCLAAYVGVPGLGILRNILEHKHSALPSMEEVEAWERHLSNESRRRITGTHVPKRVTTRNFPGFLSGLIGPVGFRYHLLHHFDPSVSYRRLPVAWRFLRETQLGPALDSSASSYLNAAVRFYRGTL